MPIRRELRDLYPAHWRELSRRVRFERAHGMCQGCGRPHGATVRCLPDGRWYDSAAKHVARPARPHRPLARPRADGAATDDARRAGRRASGSRSGQQPAAQPARPLSALPPDPRSPASSGAAADHLSAPPRLGGPVPWAVRPISMPFLVRQMCDRRLARVHRRLYPTGMNDLLNALQALRPVWPQLLGMSLFACVGMALIAS